MQLWQWPNKSPRCFIIFRKLRDEYDKLEGALRKLGVDPESVVAGGGPDDYDDEAFGDDDEEEDEEEDESDSRRRRGQTSSNATSSSSAAEVRAAKHRQQLQQIQQQVQQQTNPASSGAVIVDSTTGNVIDLEDLDPLSLQNRTDRLRRHLDILEEVSVILTILTITNY